MKFLSPIPQIRQLEASDRYRASSSNEASSSSSSNTSMTFPRNDGMLRSFAEKPKPPVWGMILPNQNRNGIYHLSDKDRADIWEIESRPYEKEMLRSAMQQAPAGTTRIFKKQRGFMWSMLYSFGPWKPIPVNKEQLPFEIKPPLLRSPEKQIGLADFMRKTSRIKEFHLSNAIVYSYVRDMRFVFATCLLIGIELWWALAPEPLLLRPDAFAAHDFQSVVQIIKDTFVKHVCSSHPEVSSPCPCGEPINNVARDLFDPTFDPLKTGGEPIVKQQLKKQQQYF